jgi:hypothetical protein
MTGLPDSVLVSSPRVLKQGVNVMVTIFVCFFYKFPAKNGQFLRKSMSRSL